MLSGTRLLKRTPPSDHDAWRVSVATGVGVAGPTGRRQLSHCVCFTWIAGGAGTASGATEPSARVTAYTPDPTAATAGVVRQRVKAMRAPSGENDGSLSHADGSA